MDKSTSNILIDCIGLEPNDPVRRTSKRKLLKRALN